MPSGHCLLCVSWVASLSSWQPLPLRSSPPGPRRRRSSRLLAQPRKQPRITFLATDPLVINYPTLTFVFLAVVAGGAPQNGLRTHRGWLLARGKDHSLPITPLHATHAPEQNRTLPSLISSGSSLQSSRPSGCNNCPEIPDKNRGGSAAPGLSDGARAVGHGDEGSRCAKQNRAPPSRNPSRI